MSTKGLSRRDFLRVAVGAAGAGLLAACGTPGAAPQAEGTTQPSEGITEPSEAVTQPPAGAAPVGEKIEPQGVLWGLQYDPHVEAYKRLAALFQEKTGSTLSVEPQSGDLTAKFIAALSAGTQPDVFCLIGHALTPLHVQKVLLPLGDLVFKTNGVDPKTAFIGDSVQAYSWENEIWGVPVESNAVGNSVNVPVDEVTALGLAEQYPPSNGQTYFESYDSMWALAKSLQKEEGGNVTRWGLSSKGWEAQNLLGIIRSLGVKWWDQDAQKFNIDSEAGVEAMQLLIERPVQMGIEAELEQNHLDAALAGKVAVARGNPTVSTNGVELGYKFEVCGVPRVRPGEDPLFVGEGGWGFIAPKTTKNPGVSAAFLQMMATEEAQLEYAKIYGGIPFFAWAGLVSDTTRFADPSPDSPNVKAAKLFATLLPRTEFFGEGFGYTGQIAPAAAEVGSEVRQGKLSAAEGAKQLQERFEAQHQQYLADTKKA